MPDDRSLVSREYSDRDDSQSQNFLVELIEAGTGMVTQSRNDVVRDISHILKKAVSGKLLEGLSDVYKKLKDDSKIKPDYQQTDQCRQQLSYVFATLDDETAIDEKRFEAVQNIFLNAAQEKEGYSDRNDPFPMVLIKIASTLNRGEIIVLQTAFRLNTEIMTKIAAGQSNTPRYDTSGKSWKELIASESGLKVSGLVGIYEKGLMDKSLISSYTPGGSVHVDTNYRLTDIGLKLCEFISDPVLING